MLLALGMTVIGGPVVIVDGSSSRTKWLVGNYVHWIWLGVTT